MEITKKEAMTHVIFNSLLAGILIGLAACIFVACGDKLVGSFLFSIGLIAVILLQAFLFTGKIGYVNSKETLKYAVVGLVFNVIAAFIVGLIFRLCNNTQTIFNSRLEKSWYKLLFDGVGCGALIYLAVELFKKKESLLVIILPVMAFILAGFEHSIADAAYYGMCELSWKGLGCIGLVIIGNAIGSLAIRELQTKFKLK